MSKFIMIYKGEATDLADMSEEDAAAVMAKWAEWLGKVGSSLADVGTPFGPGISVVDDGSVTTPVSLTGYSIVEAFRPRRGTATRRRSSLPERRVGQLRNRHLRADACSVRGLAHRRDPLIHGSCKQWQRHGAVGEQGVVETFDVEGLSKRFLGMPA